MATMQRLSGVKRKSDQLEVSDDEQNAIEAGQKTTTKKDSVHPDESPAKRQRVGVTLAQKQALIDNLQLERTFRHRHNKPYKNMMLIKISSHRARAQTASQLQHPRAEPAHAN